MLLQSHISIYVLIVALFFANIINGEIGERQDYTFTTNPNYSVADFIVIQNEQVLLVANSYSTNAVLYALDISGDNITTISTTTICQTRPYYFDMFMPINQTHFFIECMYLDASLIPHNLVEIGYWNGENVTINTNSNGTLYPGSIFPVLTPPKSSTFWFYGDNNLAPSAIGLNSTNNWQNVTSLLQLPKGYAYEYEQAGFVSADTSYLVCSSGVAGPNGTAPIWKFQLPSGELLHEITNPGGPVSIPSFTFPDYESGNSMILVVEIADDFQTATAYFTPLNFDTMQQLGTTLVMPFPHYTIYSGTAPWNAASFANGKFYVAMTTDYGTFPDVVYDIILEIQMPASPADSPVLLDQENYVYQFSHNLIATSNWLYTDTGPATISRWNISK